MALPVVSLPASWQQWQTSNSWGTKQMGGSNRASTTAADRGSSRAVQEPPPVYVPGFERMDVSPAALQLCTPCEASMHSPWVRLPGLSLYWHLSNMNGCMGDDAVLLAAGCTRRQWLVYACTGPDSELLQSAGLDAVVGAAHPEGGRGWKKTETRREKMQEHDAVQPVVHAQPPRNMLTSLL
jgi:hypothetical protein